MKKYTVKEYSEVFDIEISIGEMIIISNMMRNEADDNDVDIELHDGAPAFPKRMLDMYFSSHWSRA